MQESALLLALLALAWLSRDLAYAFAPAPVTPDGIKVPIPEKKPWEDLLMFKKGGGSSAPDPDPRIGEAALKNAELGEDWLRFAEEQFDVANERQKGLDELTNQITDRQLASQDRADKWAQQDRESSMQDREWGLSQRDQLTKQSQQDRQWGLGQRDRFNQIADDMYGRADDIAANAQSDRDFANQLRQDYDQFRPVNERMIDDALNWDSDARLAERSAEARSDVMRNAAIAQGQTSRQLAGMGVDPRSGRAQATNRSLNQQTALASAGAQNQARSQARGEAAQLRQSAASLGQNVLGQSQNATQIANSTDALANSTTQLGLGAQGAAQGAAGYASQVGANSPGMAAAGYAAGQYNAPLGAAGLGVSAGNAAQSGSLANQSSWLANQNIMGQGYSGAMQGNSSMANTLNNLYGNQLNAWQAQQSAEAQGASGLWGGIGSIVGAGLTMFSSKELKEDKKPIEGESAVKAVESMPVEKWKYKDGVADGGEHVGPYAEDFKKATGKGDGTTIPIQDLIGLNMRATQEIADKVKNLEKSVGLPKRKSS